MACANGRRVRFRTAGTGKWTYWGWTRAALLYPPEVRCRAFIPHEELAIVAMQLAECRTRTTMVSIRLQYWAYGISMVASTRDIIMVDFENGK